MLTPKVLHRVAAGVLIAATVLTASTAFADAENYTRTLPSTVWVITSDAEDQTSTGTGVFVDAEKRLIVTNAHVVGDSRNAVVFFPDIKNGQPVVKRKHYLSNILKLGTQGKVVSVDRKRDLALIELPKIPDGASPITLADSSTTPGRKVDLVGNPGGSDVLWVYTSGTVRAVYDKKFKSDHGDHDFKAVETQSPIKRGDSGGPVVNDEGELVAIAQSFSPSGNSVSFCVDISEIKSMIQGAWKPAPLPTKVVLDSADLQYTNHASGHYEIDYEISTGKTQSVFVAKDTEYYRRADVRKIWSLISTSKEAPTADVMMRLLRQSSATKIGSWAIEKSGTDEYLILFVAKVDATAPDEAFSATVQYVGRIAGAMQKELNPKAEDKSASETLAAWLAD